jgi:excisionase family DNA binding protein
MDRPLEDRRIATVKWASEILGVSVRTVYRWLEAGQFTAVPTDGEATLLYSDEVLSRKTVSSPAPDPV